MTLFFLNFFRDPDRLTPPGDHLVTSPADGKVVAVLDGVREERFLKGECRRVSIFMSPLDVHVNRIPVDGTVRRRAAHSGAVPRRVLRQSVASSTSRTRSLLEDSARRARPVRADRRRSSRAGSYANVGPGTRCDRGERYGMIMFGSRRRRLPAAGGSSPTVARRSGDRVERGTQRSIGADRAGARMTRMIPAARRPARERRPPHAAAPSRRLHPAEPAHHLRPLLRLLLDHRDA